MMATCDVNEGGSLIAMLLCMALLAYATHSWGCCDDYESSDEEGDTDAIRSMFS